MSHAASKSNDGMATRLLCVLAGANVYFASCAPLWTLLCRLSCSAQSAKTLRVTEGHSTGRPCLSHSHHRDSQPRDYLAARFCRREKLWHIKANCRGPSARKCETMSTIRIVIPAPQFFLTNRKKSKMQRGH